MWRVERTVPGVDATHDELLPFAGPAVSLPLWSLLARLPFDTARDVWLAALGVALVVLAVASAALARAPLSLARIASALLLTLVSGCAISDVALGQIAVVAAAGVALALLALERGSVWAVPAALVATVQPNLAVPLAARLTERRSALLLAAAGAVFAALTLTLGGGPAGFASYLHRIGELGAGERFDVIQYGVPAIAASFGVARPVAAQAGVACSALALIAGAAAAWRLRARAVLAAAIAIALLPWLVPFFHQHDFVIELIPAIALAGAADVRVRTLGAIGATCVLVNWLGVAQRPATAAHEVCLAFATACAVIALAQTASGRASPWPALRAAGLLAGLAFPFALAFPVPVWPDALGAFHAGAHLDAAAVWAAEQQRAGLMQARPAAGILRAIPLLGCAVLALAAYVAAKPAAMTIRSPRTVSGTAVNDAPSHGPATQ